MKKQKRFSGASLVEFALVLPLFIFLATGFLDLGRAIFYYSSLTNAVRESTRYAIVNHDDLEAAYNNPANNSLQDKVLEYAFGLTAVPNALEKEDVTVIIEMIDGKFTTVTIQTDYLYEPITPGIELLFGGSGGINLVARSRMLVTLGAM